ncbi:MAG: LysR family transcriptional regulator [Alphaproteobacteria bacterium]|nr:LysR family transcriptional regulator [Alphaproteobacteria bacterium]
MGALLDGMEAFVAVCESGSVSGGARVLGVPRTTVSRRLAELEEELGVRLLHRSTRRLVRTGAGDELFGRARRIVDDAESARRAVAAMDGVPRGLLRVSVPPEVAETLQDVLLGFLDLYPEVDLEVEASARFVDLVAEGFDVALRGGRLTDDRLVARRLRTTRAMAYAAPAYLEAHGEPRTADDLAHHACIRMFARGTVPHTHWPLLDGGTVAVHGRLATSSLRFVERAVAEGRGIGMLPWAPRGTVPVLPDVVGQVGHVSVVYPERALLPSRVRAFVDHLVAHQHLLTPERS